ncbi:MAG: tryptophan 7-halogenase, partial [Thermoplasmatales archaeon]
LEVQGYTKSLEMHSAVFSKDGKVNQFLSENLLSLLQKEESIQGIDNFKLHDFWIEEAYKIGREYIAALRTSRKEQLQARNAKVINDRVESLKQSTEIEIERLTRLLQEARNPKIITMREGQIRNTRINLENKIKELTQKQEVTVSSDLVAGGYLVVE